MIKEQSGGAYFAINLPFFKREYTGQKATFACILTIYIIAALSFGAGVAIPCLDYWIEGLTP